MLIYSSVKLFALGAFIGLAILGAFLFYASRRGLVRNGYFSLPAVILIVLALFVAFQTLGYVVTLATIGSKVEDQPVAALAINGLCELLVLMVGTFLISKLARQDMFAAFRLEGFYETPGVTYLLAVPLILAAQYFGGALVAIWTRLWKFFPDAYQAIDQYESAADKAQQGLVTAHGVLDFLLIFIFVAFVPALSEETLFRGFAQSNIERSGHKRSRPWIALFVASFLFACIHGSVFKLPGLFVLGFALGWMSYRTSNLFVGALAHAVNNGAIVLALFLLPEATGADNSNLVNSDQLSASGALVLLMFVLPVLAGFVYLFHWRTEPLQARHNAELEVHAWNSDSVHVEFHDEPNDTESHE